MSRQAQAMEFTDRRDGSLNIPRGSANYPEVPTKSAVWGAATASGRKRLGSPKHDVGYTYSSKASHFRQCHQVCPPLPSCSYLRAGQRGCRRFGATAETAAVRIKVMADPFTSASNSPSRRDKKLHRNLVNNPCRVVSSVGIRKSSSRHKPGALRICTPTSAPSRSRH